MSAEEILKLIEVVDPSDTAKLDEIDARVCLFAQPELSPLAYYTASEERDPEAKAIEHMLHFRDRPKYTRSRDALKAIRPEGWSPFSWCELAFLADDVERKNPFWGRYAHRLTQDEFGICQYNVVGLCATEELAELHAIIQAIQLERSVPIHREGRDQ